VVCRHRQARPVATARSRLGGAISLILYRISGCVTFDPTLTDATDVSYYCGDECPVEEVARRQGCQFFGMKSGRELGKGLVEKIKKDLGLKGE
jgi:hypothetical protein